MGHCECVCRLCERKERRYIVGGYVCMLCERKRQSVRDSVVECVGYVKERVSTGWECV